MRLSYEYSSQHTHQPKKHILKAYKKKKSFIRSLVRISLGGFLLGLFLIIGYAGWISRDLPNPNQLIYRALPVSTRIYTRDRKNILYEIHGAEQRTLISLKQVPQYAQWATITVEDKNFYRHKGFDIKGIFRAIIIDIIRGGKAQGGSTITQQFIKNALLSGEKRFSRKLKELILSYQLEKRFSKDEILQLYFNEIPYGSTAYGIQSASKIYFGKNVEEITIAESAVLAALPKAPTYYSPWGNNRDKLLAREKRILDDMVLEGYITKEEAELSKQEKIIFREPGAGITAPHFVFYIKELLTEIYGEKIVEQGGLSVITTLDYDKQLLAQKIVKKWGEKNAKTKKASNAALVSLDPKTGEILAMVGSRDYFNRDIDGNVNVVLKKRQPGSSFKPIVYAAAFKKGYTPKTILFDVLTDFDTTKKKPYIPHNYTNKEYGPVSMKQALAGSLNIASVKTLYLAGVNNVIEFAKTLGYSSLSNADQYGLSLVLGGAEVTLLEHTNAFSIFAQDGKKVTPIALLEIKDKNNETIFRYIPQQPQEILDPEIARIITSILSDASAREFIFGSSPYLSLKDRQSAVKTGTTNDFRDAWIIGYTPSLLTGIWVGNNNNIPMEKGADGSKIAAPIWNEFMNEVLKDTQKENFSYPQEIITGKAVLDGSIGEEKIRLIDTLTGLEATSTTPILQVEERKEQKFHTILSYISKDDPRGSFPQHPEEDPQYLLWEEGIQKWIQKNNSSFKEKRKEFIKNIPPQKEEISLSILSPNENEIITSPELNISLSSSAPSGIKKVEFFLDDSLLSTKESSPFSLLQNISSFGNGFHTLTVKSYNNNGNFQSASLNLNFLFQ